MPFELPPQMRSDEQANQQANELSLSAAIGVIHNFGGLTNPDRNNGNDNGASLSMLPGIDISSQLTHPTELTAPAMKSDFIAGAGSTMYAEHGSHVLAKSGSIVYAENGSEVTAQAGATIYASSGSHVIAGDRCSVNATQGPTIHASKDVRIDVGSGATVDAFKDALIDIKGPSTVNAYDGSVIYARSERAHRAYITYPSYYVDDYWKNAWHSTVRTKGSCTIYAMEDVDIETEPGTTAKVHGWEDR